MSAPETPLIRPGEEVRTRLRFSREDIVAFARLSGDANPLHHDTLAHDTHTQLRQVFDALRALMASPPEPPKRPIGFVTTDGQSVR